MCVCVQPVVHTGMGSLPMRLLLLSICMLCLVHPVGGQGEGWGALSNEAPPPHPRKRTHIVCSWVPECVHLISCCAIPSVWLSGAGPLYPDVLISFCFAGMPFLLFGVPLESKSSFMFHACLSRPPLGSVKPLQPHVI